MFHCASAENTKAGLTPHDDGHLHIKVAQRESADAAQVPSLVGHVYACDD